MFPNMLKSLTVALLFYGYHAFAVEYYVDNVKGDDQNSGLKQAPFKTIAHVLKLLKGGDTLNLVPNKNLPYTECIDSNTTGFWGGTKENPTIIDGHGSVISGLVQLPANAWKEEGDGVFSRHLPNNAWVMDRQGYWSGFPIVFFEGKPANFCKSKEELKDFTYFLFKSYPENSQGKRDARHNTLYIKLPAGKTPDDITVKSIISTTNIHINRDYVTVRNIISIYTGGDGFSTTRSKGLVFENVRGAYCMDQGMSHHGAEVLIKNSRFDHNAGCGVVDVYTECKTKYVDCVIEDDFYRGGVEFHRGTFEMSNCVIRNNTGKALSMGKGSKVKLTNCLFWVKDQKYAGVSIGDGKIEMRNCTIYNGKTGISIWINDKEIQADITNNVFINNKENYFWNKPKQAGIDKFHIDYNVLTPAPLKAYGQTYTADQWNDYREATGFDAHSLISVYNGKVPPCQTDFRIDDKVVGANIKQD